MDWVGLLEETDELLGVADNVWDWMENYIFVVVEMFYILWSRSYMKPNVDLPFQIGLSFSLLPTTESSLHNHNIHMKLLYNWTIFFFSFVSKNN